MSTDDYQRFNLWFLWASKVELEEILLLLLLIHLLVYLFLVACYLLIVGCTGSSLLRGGFLQLQTEGTALWLLCMGFSSQWLLSAEHMLQGEQSQWLQLADSRVCGFQ